MGGAYKILFTYINCLVVDAVRYCYKYRFVGFIYFVCCVFVVVTLSKPMTHFTIHYFMPGGGESRFAHARRIKYFLIA